MQLYFATGTCSLSPHIVLQELGLDYDLVRVNNRTKRTSLGEDYLSVNPKGYVAALRLDSGQVLTEGPVLVQYLADLRPDARLAPAPESFERVRLQEWLSFIASELHTGATPLFDDGLPGATREAFRSRLCRRIDVVETALAAGEHLLPDGFSIADAYLFTVLSWTPRFGIDLAAWPATAAYVRRVSARPSVSRALDREADAPPVE